MDGPATAGIGSWIDEFLNATSTLNIPIDFVSSHDYPPQGNGKSIDTNIFYNSLNGINNILAKYNKTYPNIPYYLSEFNSGLFWENKNNQTVHNFDNQDTIYAASFMIFQMNKLQKLFGSDNKHYQLLSYWTFSDIFEEGGFRSYPFWPNATFNQGNDIDFGMTTIRGINKPVFNAFQIVYNYGSTTQYNTELINGGNKDDGNNTVSIFCLKNDKNESENRYSLFMTNYADYPFPENEFKNVSASINVTQTIDTSLKQPKSAMIYKIDKENGNSYQEWIEMGKPEYPTNDQLSQLKKSSELIGNNFEWKVINDTTVEFVVDIPRYTVVLIDMQY